MVGSEGSAASALLYASKASPTYSSAPASVALFVLTRPFLVDQGEVLEGCRVLGKKAFKSPKTSMASSASPSRALRMPRLVNSWRISRFDGKDETPVVISVEILRSHARTFRAPATIASQLSSSMFGAAVPSGYVDRQRNIGIKSE